MSIGKRSKAEIDFSVAHIVLLLFTALTYNLLHKFNEEAHHSSLKHLFTYTVKLLFEGFIGGFMGEVLHGKAKVRLQASELTLISDVVYDGQSLGKAFTMRHDIFVEHKEHGLFVLDTKYKHMSRFEGNDDVKRSVTNEVAQADLYQVIEYAAHRDLDKAYLLYPMYRFEEDEPAEVVLERKSVSGKQVFVHVVRLPFIFEEDFEATKESLKKSINQIFA